MPTVSSEWTWRSAYRILGTGVVEFTVMYSCVVRMMAPELSIMGTARV